MRKSNAVRLVDLAAALRTQGNVLAGQGVGGAGDAIELWRDACELLCSVWETSDEEHDRSCKLLDDLFGSLGELLMRRREPREAVDCLEKQLQFHLKLRGHRSQGLFKIFFNLASAYLGVHNIDMARTFAKRGIALSDQLSGLVVPDLVRLYYVLCRVERQAFNNEAGQAAIARALSLLESDPELLPTEEADFIKSFATSLLA